MLPQTAHRFAESSLAIYGREGRFSVSITSEEEVEPIAQAFEELGCTVIREPFRLRLVVTCSTEENKRPSPPLSD